jgi:TonB family protein
MSISWGRKCFCFGGSEAMKWILWGGIAFVIQALLFFWAPWARMLIEKPERKELHATELIQAWVPPTPELISEPEPQPVSASPFAQEVSPSVSLTDPSALFVGTLAAAGAQEFAHMLRAGFGDKVFDPDQVDEQARALRSGSPDTPIRARREGVSGEVEAVFIVDVHGRARNVQILRVHPVGYGFERSVQEFLEQRARFEPARIENVVVQQNVTQKFIFRVQRD